MSASPESAALLAPDGTPLTWHCHRCGHLLGEVAGPSALRDRDGRVFEAGSRHLVVVCTCGFRNRFFRPTPIDKTTAGGSR